MLLICTLCMPNSITNPQIIKSHTTIIPWIYSFFYSESEGGGGPDQLSLLQLPSGNTLNPLMRWDSWDQSEGAGMGVHLSSRGNSFLGLSFLFSFRVWCTLLEMFIIFEDPVSSKDKIRDWFPNLFLFMSFHIAQQVIAMIFSSFWLQTEHKVVHLSLKQPLKSSLGSWAGPILFQRGFIWIHRNNTWSVDSNELLTYWV